MAGKTLPFTEQWWLRSMDYTTMIRRMGRRLSKRKRILFGCSTARLVWDFVKKKCNRKAILTSESYADGRATKADMTRAWGEIKWEPAMYTEWHIVALTAKLPYRDTTEEDLERLNRVDRAPFSKSKLDWANNLREIVGNPFQTITIDPAWLVANDGIVSSLATAIYDEYGFDRLPILADALEDAGCAEARLLEHLRGPGPHYRGCWALDRVLGTV